MFFSGRECHDQHDMLVAVLLSAGGIEAESLRATGPRSKIADVYFPDEPAVVEVKSLTTNRPTMSVVQEAIGEQLATDAIKFGGPIVYGRTRISLTDLPEPTAKNVLRRIGRPVIDAVSSANDQIKATKALLQTPKAIGCIGLICPPHDLDHEVLSWLISDTLRNGKNRSVNCTIIAQSPILAPFGKFESNSTAMMFGSRDDVGLSEALRIKIGKEWAKAHGQMFVNGFPAPGWHGQRRQ